MVKTTGNAPETEPEQKSFKKVPEGEHLFQVVDVIENLDSDADIVHVKCEVIDENGQGTTLLNRLSLNDEWKGFFATRLFLKAISEPYKGQDFPIDTDAWIGRRFCAIVVHNGDYANIKEFLFKEIKQPVTSVGGGEIKSDEIAWDDEK